ncbi:MAG TPA: dihydrolipoamide succinyltransferase, partial [Rhodobiaceae bacterium]|nr:dihydrolipoamide succinyltransferase [Rhodobiaceae bacterium]
LETDKVTVEVPAPSAGILSEIIAKDGETVEVGALLGQIGEGKGAAPAPKKEEPKKTEAKTEAKTEVSPDPKKEEPKQEEAKGPSKPADAEPSPAVRRVAAENDLDVSKVKGTGKGGRVTKADAEEAASSAKAPSPAKAPEAPVRAPAPADQGAREERVKMTRLRKTIATRLKEAQNTAA